MQQLMPKQAKKKKNPQKTQKQKIPSRHRKIQLFLIFSKKNKPNMAHSRKNIIKRNKISILYESSQVKCTNIHCVSVLSRLICCLLLGLRFTIMVQSAFWGSQSNWKINYNMF